MSPQGNPLNALAGGFSGGILGAKPQEITVSYDNPYGLASIQNGFGYTGIAPLPAVPKHILHGPTTNSRIQGYETQLNDFAQQRQALNAQLASARQSLANRSFYELYDKHADRSTIATLQDQLQVVVGKQSVARDNLYAARDSLYNNAALQTFSYQTSDHFSVGSAGLSGLGTGGKAVVNAAASSATLGFYEGPLGVTQQDINNGYNTSRFIAGVSTELLVGLATGGAAKYGKLGKAALAFDTAGNAVSVGQGVTSAYNEGLGFGNSLQIVGGAVGLGGNIAAGGKALRELASDASRLRVDFSGARTSLSMSGLGGAKITQAQKGVTAYQVGLFNDLQAASKVGDKLQLHHVGQKHALQQLIPGYSPRTAPAIVLPDIEHFRIPNLRGTVTRSVRDVLARDIRNIRNLTSTPNSALQEVLSLNKHLFPQAFKK